MILPRGADDDATDRLDDVTKISHGSVALLILVDGTN